MGSQEAMQVLVLGGGYAGVLAALRVQGKLGASARVTLVNGAPHLVERVRLHEVAAGGRLPRHDLSELTAGSGVELCVGWVESLELSERIAHVRTATGLEARRFDLLVYALGSRAEAVTVPGAQEHAVPLADEASAQRLCGRLAALPSGSEVTVVGGGLTAVEVATEIAERLPHLDVQLVSRGRVGSGLSDGARRYLASVFDDLGVQAREGVAVKRVDADRVWLANGESLPSRVTIWAGGLVPNPLARAAGLATSPSGQLLVDGALRSRSHPFVFGAGDGMAIDSPRAAHLRMACATAMPLAAHAADNVVRQHRGEPLEPFGFSFVIQCLSLGRRRGLVQAVRADDTPRRIYLTGVAGAWVKERVVRATVAALHRERQRPGVFWWPGRRMPLEGRA